jgi:integrase
MKLTDRFVKHAPDGWHCDGNGLYLQVSNSGRGRSWVFRFVLDGRQRYQGLGPYPLISLAEARDKAFAARRLKLDGIDPLQVRRDQRAAQRAESAKAMTFRQCAEGFIKDNESKWTNGTHRQQWTTTLRQYVYPMLGSLPVAAIDTPLVLKVIKPLWAEKTETASRIRGRIEQVLGWATVHHYRQGDNPARWQGLLEHALPSPAKTKVVHLAALPYPEVPQFMIELRGRDEISAKALEFTVLTAARAGEVLGMVWTEIEGDVWTIPAERMKAKKEHRAPLSRRAAEILASLPRTGEHVFPIERKRGMLRPLQELRPGVTVHGFRSSFRDWAAERTNFPREVAEMALAHAIPSAVEAAYRRGDLFTKRSKLMESWGQYCERPISGQVTTFRSVG